MRILLITPPERKDYYYYLNKAEGVEFDLLFYLHAKEAEGIIFPSFIKKQYFWSQFRNPAEVFNTIRPDRIVFFEIIDQRQIALIVAAKHFKIPTFYLEHGASGDAETIKRFIETGKVSFIFLKRIPAILKRLTSSLRDMVKVKQFYFYSLRFLKGKSRKKYFRLPLHTTVSKLGKALITLKFPERVPDKNILFNEANFEEFELYTGITKDQAIIEGVPFFDSYYREHFDHSGPIVYIDSPFLEHEYNGWTAQHHKKIALSLLEFAEKFGEKIIIKLHPRSSKAIWDSYHINSPFIEIVQDGDFHETYLRSKLILGYTSSLINGLLCARKNIVSLGWHPMPHISGADFSRTGLCHCSFIPEELQLKYSEWLNKNLALEDELAYANFLKRFNSPFDGKATERVINAILHS